MGQEQLSFIGLTTTAIKIVVSMYPNASFRGATGNVPNNGTTTDPKDLTKWDFNFGDETTRAMINLQTKGEWGDFGTPIYSKHATGGKVIPWPIDLDIIEAHNLLQNAGYKNPFNNVTLRWPMYDPPREEPLYIFSFPERDPVAVGVYNKDVFQF